jgi:hypothetical protein
MPLVARILLTWTAVSVALGPMVGTMLARRPQPQPVKA